MENLRFEDSFKEAFNGAEIAPSGVVWTNVELRLEKSSGGKLKGRILFFQLLAAASMVFAMGVGSVYFLNPTTEPSHPIGVVQESPKSIQNQEQVSTQNLSANGDQLGEDQKSISKVDTSKKNEKRSGYSLKLAGESSEVNSSVNVATEPAQKISDSETSFFSRALPSLVEVRNPQLNVSTSEPDPGMMLLAKLHDEEKKLQKNKPTLKEKIWASLGIGAGSYNPNTSSSMDRSMALSGSGSSFAGQPLGEPSAGTSYSVGVSVASKISKRVVLQGGISYLTQNSTYTSNTVSGSGAFLNDYAGLSREDAAKDQISTTTPYQVNNNLQYMSIPLQAGYIIIDRDFGLQLNAGISTDVFFQNTLTPEGSDLDEVSQGPGDDSPYRTLNFSGLLGTELSYKVSDHYRIAVNPGVRYALNSIYKSELSAEVSPITFDVALRFRYMF
ncbi:MAG TPA: outer membrane beta-barrel protein [Cyclobacteriaceae bacterium]|nr:outer membrane beta-barrel protein [Cyclobacteriaceae bacterium]